MGHAVFVIDGNDVGAYPSVEDAEASIEAYDADALTGYLDDGTRLELTADWDTYRCRMRPTNERDLSTLQDRLRGSLSASGLDPALADNPRAAAQAIIDADWAVRSFRWFPWLDRRLNGREASRIV
jgi:hypothetical protein